MGIKHMFKQSEVLSLTPARGNNNAVSSFKVISWNPFSKHKFSYSL